MKNYRALKYFIISSLFMVVACTSNQEKDEIIMSSYCKEAYENLYGTYNNNSLGSSGTENALSLLFIASDNYVKKDEYERLEKECN